METLINIIGYAAGICMAISQFPQAWLVYKTGKTENISLLMFSILTGGVFCWFLYGILSKTTVIWLTNGICLIPSFYVLYKCISNKIKKNTSGVSKIEHTVLGK